MSRFTTQDPESTAILALGFLASDPERLDRFLALTGLDPTDIRAAATSSGFLAAVLDHVMGDEALLLAFAADSNLPPETIAVARQMLG